MGKTLPQDALHPLIRSYVRSLAEQSPHGGIIVEEKFLGVPFSGATIGSGDGTDLGFS